jgi:hypothetical protein
VDFSAHISTTGIVPHFVAAIDAAFFQIETFSRPEAAVRSPITVPEFFPECWNRKDKAQYFSKDR